MSERKALICEDDPAIRSLVKTVVKREGFDVDTAADGAEGMEKMKDACYDLLVLDLMMPGVDGYQVIEHLQSRAAERLQRVVVMTAAAEAMRSEFPAPICTLLTKPFDIDQLTAAVRECAAGCS